MVAGYYREKGYVRARIGNPEVKRRNRRPQDALDQRG